jgi:hypothetical protein
MWHIHVVYTCISVLINHDCPTHPILPFITVTTRFLSKHCIKRILDRDEWLLLFQFYGKTFLRSVDPKQPKNVKFSLWSIIETSRGGAYDVSEEVKNSQGRCKTISGEVLTSPQNPAMESGFTMQRIMPMWKYWKHRTNSDIDTWDKRNGMLCSSEQLLVVRILDTKSSYKGDNAPGVEKVSDSQKIFPHARKKKL